MNRNLFKRIVVICLMCICLLTIITPGTHAEKYKKKEPISGWNCTYCYSANYINKYTGVLDESYKPIQQTDGKTHSIGLNDEIRCDNPNCPYRLEHGKSYVLYVTYYSEKEPHGIKASHSGNDVAVSCTKCAFNKKVTHNAYITNYGTRVRQASKSFTYENSKYHRLKVYDLYQCNIPGCTQTATKLVNNNTSEHRYHTVTKQLTGRLYQVWEECWDCHHQKNKHTEYR